jgi:hypothetical protein
MGEEIGYEARLELPYLVGLMLPDNVTVEKPVSGSTIGRIENPEIMMAVSCLNIKPVSVDVAKQALSRLDHIIEKLGAG